MIQKQAKFKKMSSCYKYVSEIKTERQNNENIANI